MAADGRTLTETASHASGAGMPMMRTNHFMHAVVASPLPTSSDLTCQVIAEQSAAANTRPNFDSGETKMRVVGCTSILAGALMAMTSHAQDGVGDYRGLPADLAAAATAYDVAQMKADRTGLERYLADDYTLANTDGRNEGKAESIAESTAPDRSTTSVIISRQLRKVWSNGAVLGGMVDAKGVERGRPSMLHARFVDVWARRDGRWQVIFTQIHTVPSGE
jgi:hypothetical protein